MREVATNPNEMTSTEPSADPSQAGSPGGGPRWTVRSVMVIQRPNAADASPDPERSSMTIPDARQTVETIFRIEWPRLVAGLTRIVRDVDLAEELAQDA